jgi:hypothetical protein
MKSVYTRFVENNTNSTQNTKCAGVQKAVTYSPIQRNVIYVVVGDICEGLIP